MPTELERRARELLGRGTPMARLQWILDELAKLFPDAHSMLASDPPEPKYIAAIAAALQAQQPTNSAIRDFRATEFDTAQQPGAQAVGYVSPHVIEHLRNGGHSCTTITAHRAMLDDVALYTQLPSIPEPSEADVEAAINAWVSTEGGEAAMHAALTTYTARLRERIGQAPGGDGDA
jgi:hypothetical protein